MKRVLAVFIFLGACYRPPYDLWREQLGFNVYPAEGSFCGVAPDDLSQSRAARVKAWCRGHTARLEVWCAQPGDKPDWCKDPKGADQMRWFVRVASEEDADAYSEYRGWSRINATSTYVSYGPDIWMIDVRESLFEHSVSAENVLQHEWCHTQGENHKGDDGFRPNQCPVK